MTNTENLFGLADEAEEYNTFDELREITIKCRKCGLAEGRTNVVFGEGDPNADLLFIGEGPGMHEDLQGRPFVGRAGQLLDKMIIAMGFKREQVYIANIVKCRPPGNRDPLPDEVAMCVPYLKAQINFIKPKIIVLLGAVAVRALLDSKEGITKIRGRIMDYYGVPIMPVYHPAYLLRNPAKKKEAWEDLQKVMAFLAENR
ncbi:MAG: uracil-DNA glycosylase [Acidobacteria bacterium]|nr:uracil-DNA glycosylase [Acidobacteriota bacterium]